MKILYVSAHLGDGAGKAVVGMAVGCAKRGFEQKILLLEKPEKTVYVKEGRHEGIEIIVLDDDTDVEALLTWSDTVVVNWWNHPLMSRFLVKLPKVPCRMVLWSHVNGCSYPYLPYDFAAAFDRALFTTRYSLENPLWTAKQRDDLLRKSDIVQGMGEFYPEQIQPKTDYSGAFTVGYAGTINYSKMHSDYISYCETAIREIPGIRFLMVGKADSAVLDEVEQKGLSDHFTFTGFVEDIYEYYRKMDVMGYLLNEDNYATTENVILEAMACAVPVVARGNPPERCIIDNGSTGYLVESCGEYVEILKKLYSDRDKCKKIGQSGREHVCHSYSADANCERFVRALEDVQNITPSIKTFEQILGETPYGWFKKFTGTDRELFEKSDGGELQKMLKSLPPIYTGKTKSSVRQFAKYYPQDTALAELSAAAEKCEVDR
jgi:glycosyltransferase involved in cell wall biosynthesis